MNKPVQGQRCIFCVLNNELLLFRRCHKGTYFPLPGIRNGLLIHPVVLFFLVRTQPLSCQSCLSMIPPHPTSAHTRTHTHTHTNTEAKGDVPFVTLRIFFFLFRNFAIPAHSHAHTCTHSCTHAHK